MIQKNMFLFVFLVGWLISQKSNVHFVELLTSYIKFYTQINNNQHTQSPTIYRCVKGRGAW